MNERLEKLEKRYLEVEELLGRQEVVSDTEQYNRLAKELSDLKDKVFPFRELKDVLRQQQELEHLLNEKHDRDFLEMISKESDDLKHRKERLEEQIKQALFVDNPEDNRDMMVEIRQGTGGLEAALFAKDLYRMYTRYAELKGWSVESLAAHTTEHDGFKEVIFSVKGKQAYKHLKFESGVHRVQRVPETEAQGRIHTSTATVAVLAEAEEVDYVIEPKDLKIETYRSSGPGGQHMQKTDSAVRITHLPTGVVVACQDERSQGKNKNKAMRILRTRLLDAKKQEDTRKLSVERRSQIGSGDRSEKIRTYNFPDRRVTDHRINFTSHQLESILEGNLDELMDALIKAAEEKAEKVQKAQE